MLGILNPTRFVIEPFFIGNIIWFVPFGWGLLAFGKVGHVWMAALCGLILSLIIETLQCLFGTGVSEPDDLILNNRRMGRRSIAGISVFPRPLEIKVKGCIFYMVHSPVQ